VLNGLLSWLFISLGLGIDGVALGTVLAHFIFSVVTIGYVYMHFREPLSACFRFLGFVYAPFVYAGVLLFVLEQAPLFAGEGVWERVLLTALQVAVFSAAFALVFLLVRKHAVFTRLMDSLPRMRRRAPPAAVG
jgi:hypothetical protein